MSVNSRVTCLLRIFHPKTRHDDGLPGDYEVNN